MANDIHPSQTLANSESDVIIEYREKVPEIVEYLTKNLNKLQSLKYEIEDVFNAEEAYEILDEDLPGDSNDGHKDVFIHDIIRLSTLFFQMNKHNRMTLKIEIVTTDMCRLFHEDFYRQRLLCTYLGPGTEWLNQSNVNRNALGKGCNTKIVKDFNLINRANAFEVLLLKGTNHEGSNLSNVHRSPPIERTKTTRVLLKIDE